MRDGGSVSKCHAKFSIFTPTTRVLQRKSTSIFHTKQPWMTGNWKGENIGTFSCENALVYLVGWIGFFFLLENCQLKYWYGEMQILSQNSVNFAIMHEIPKQK